MQISKVILASLLIIACSIKESQACDTTWEPAKSYLGKYPMPDNLCKGTFCTFGLQCESGTCKNEPTQTAVN